jgi:hypothetical protein
MLADQLVTAQVRAWPLEFFGKSPNLAPVSPNLSLPRFCQAMSPEKTCAIDMRGHPTHSVRDDPTELASVVSDS